MARKRGMSPWYEAELLGTLLFLDIKENLNIVGVEILETVEMFTPMGLNSTGGAVLN